jgi:hypothetical protein
MVDTSAPALNAKKQSFFPWLISLGLRGIANLLLRLLGEIARRAVTDPSSFLAILLCLAAWIGMRRVHFDPSVGYRMDFWGWWEYIHPMKSPESPEVLFAIMMGLMLYVIIGVASMLLNKQARVLSSVADILLSGFAAVIFLVVLWDYHNGYLVLSTLQWHTAIGGFVAAASETALNILGIIRLSQRTISQDSDNAHNPITASN